MSVKDLETSWIEGYEDNELGTGNNPFEKPENIEETYGIIADFLQRKEDMYLSYKEMNYLYILMRNAISVDMRDLDRDGEYSKYVEYILRDSFDKESRSAVIPILQKTLKNLFLKIKKNDSIVLEKHECSLLLLMLDRLIEEKSEVIKNSVHDENSEVVRTNQERERIKWKSLIQTLIAVKSMDRSEVLKGIKSLNKRFDSVIGSDGREFLIVFSRGKMLGVENNPEEFYNKYRYEDLLEWLKKEIKNYRIGMNIKKIPSFEEMLEEEGYEDGAQIALIVGVTRWVVENSVSNTKPKNPEKKFKQEIERQLASITS